MQLARDQDIPVDNPDFKLTEACCDSGQSQQLPERQLIDREGEVLKRAELVTKAIDPLRQVEPRRDVAQRNLKLLDDDVLPDRAVGEDQAALPLFQAEGEACSFRRWLRPHWSTSSKTAPSRPLQKSRDNTGRAARHAISRAVDVFASGGERALEALNELPNARAMLTRKTAHVQVELTAIPQHERHLLVIVQHIHALNAPNGQPNGRCLGALCVNKDELTARGPEVHQLAEGARRLPCGCHHMPWEFDREQDLFARH